MKNQFTITQTTPEPGKRRIFYGWYIVLASWTVIFLINAVNVGIFFKPILEELAWNRAALSGIHTSALLLSAAVSPFLGRFTDRYGAKAMLFISVGAQTLSNTVTGLAGSMWHIFIARFLYGIRPLQAIQVLINRWFVKKRGRAQGIAATGMPLGALVLPLLSQYLISGWGWRPVMFFWAGIFFIIMLPLTMMIRNHPSDKGTFPDGEITLEGESDKQISEMKTAAVSGKAMSEVARTASFWLVMTTQLVCGIGCGFMMTHIVIFATDVGFSEMIGASFLSVQGGLNLVGVLLTGHISDRYSRSKALALTHFIRSLSFFTVVFFVISGSGSLWMLYASMALFGFGWFTTAPLSSGLVADIFGNRRMGSIIGTIFASHAVGMAAGTYAGGITFELTGSYYTFFLVQGILECLAAVGAFVIRRQKAT